MQVHTAADKKQHPQSDLCYSLPFITAFLHILTSYFIKGFNYALHALVVAPVEPGAKF